MKTNKKVNIYLCRDGTLGRYLGTFELPDDYQFPNEGEPRDFEGCGLYLGVHEYEEHEEHHEH